jgi:flagellar hook assembly protein FlgD
MSRLQLVRAILLLGVLASQHAGLSHAEWVQTNGPKGGTIRSFVAVPNEIDGTRLYAGQIRLWSTDDAGASWTHLSNGLTDPNAFSLLAVPNASGGNDILVGTNGGIFRSTDDGSSWSAINNGITNLSVYALASGPNGSGGTNLYAGTYMGNAYRSTDNGATWTAIQTGLPTGYNVNAITTTSGGTLLAGTMNGIYRSTNFGGSWTQAFNLFAFAFAKNGSTLYAGTSNGVYRSTNDGASWTPINTGLNFTWIHSMAAIPNASGVTLFAGAGYVLRSTDNGASWQIVNNGLTSLSVYALATVPNESGGTDLYAGASEGVFRSSDNGDHWTNVSFRYSCIQGLEVTPSGAVLAATEADVFRSTDGGETWTDTNSGASPLDLAVNPHSPSGISLFVGGSPTGVHKSTDDGLSWNESNNSLDDVDVNSVGVVPNGSGGSNILAGTCSELFVSTNDGGYWQATNASSLPLDYVVTPNGSGGHNVFGGGVGGVWVSANYGITWAATGFPIDKSPQGMATTENGANLFAAGDPFGVYRSTDDGASWTPVNDGLTDLRLVALASPDGIHLFAAGVGGVFLSSDNGDSWTSVGEGLTTAVSSLAVSGDGSTLLAGTANFGVWKRDLAEMIGTPSSLGNAPLLSGIALRTNYPNPFGAGGTTIHFALPQAMPARLVVYDVAGRAVRTLVSGMQQAGELRVTWDGRTQTGTRVGRGVYVYRLEAGGTSRTGKMLVE